MLQLQATKNDLSQSTRQEMIRLLNAQLADGIHLALQAKQAHWNVKGPQFLQLHELFDKLHAEATEWSDLIAERAVQLGGVAETTLALLSERTRLPAMSLELTAGREHVDAVSDSLAAFGTSVRQAIDIAGKAGDMDTADLFTEVSRAVDKMLWLVEAHLQGEN